MIPGPLWGGGLFIADKSVWDRASHPQVAPMWAATLRAGQILTCVISRMEILYSARTAEEFATWEADFAGLRDVPITRGELDAAVGAMRELADRDPAYHRVALPDCIIAAAAASHGIGVVHYDKHYDRLSEVLHFESRWVVPRGTLTDNPAVVPPSGEGEQWGIGHRLRRVRRERRDQD